MKLYVHSHGAIQQAYQPKELETIQEMITTLSKGVKADVLLHGRPIVNKTMLVQSLYNDLDTVYLEVQQDTHFSPLTKYSFYDLDDWNVRIVVELKGLGKLPADNIRLRFFERSFEIKIYDYNGKNWVFGIGRTQCAINIEGSKILVKADKLLVTLRKVKKDDNWFSIHKVKTIGGHDSD